MQFELITDMQTALPEIIDFNYSELKAELAERLEYYHGLVVTADEIKAAKEDKAKLNKLKKAIDDKRKEVKKQYMAPFDDFETKCKELVKMVDAPINEIDGQLKRFEEERKAEKRQSIELTYSELVPDEIKDIIPLDRIFDERWLNSTVSLKKVAEDMLEITKRVKADMVALDTVEPEYMTAVRAKYIETMDIVATLEYKKTLQEANAAFQTTETPEPKESIAPAPKIATAATNEPKRYALRLQLEVTTEQAAALKQFLTDSGIKYNKI